MEATKINFRQLILAREYRGYSQSQLSDAIKGLSQSNLSKFEKGLGGLSDDIIDSIILYLNFPKNFFYEKISNNVDNAHYRKRSTITKNDRLNFDTNIKLIGYIIDKMSESIEWSDYNFPTFDVEDFSPEYIAKFVRNKLKITPHDPIENIFGLLENNGIIVVEFDSDSEKFDGVSFLTDIGRTPVIVINKNFTNDRKRFTLAHELGHILMHLNCESPISEYRNREEEANNFASEFLMPKDSIYQSLFNLKLSDLAELKKYWLTSMASIIYRAKSLGCINIDKSTYLNIELSRRGWKKIEPFDVEIDEPKLFETAFRLHKEELSYSKEDFINGFSLPFEIIESYLNKPKNKLRIIA
jgi:Zn-dependent peptidase ImmA (M78 family)